MGESAGTRRASGEEGGKDLRHVRALRDRTGTSGIWRVGGNSDYRVEL